MNPLKEVKDDLLQTLLTAGFSFKKNDLGLPEAEHGDLALRCFVVAKNKKIAPNELAKQVADIINRAELPSITKAVAVGPYVNINLNRDKFSIDVLKTITKHPNKFTNEEDPTKKHIVLEFVSPNTNKPLHVGHLRNAAIGESVAKLLETKGHKITKAELINDRGIHIMKSLLAYIKWGNNETPATNNLKGDHLVGKYYVRFSQEADNDDSLAEQAQGYLRRWENGDAELKKVWKQLNTWAETGLMETTKRLGVAFDRVDYESDIYMDGRVIAKQAIDKGVAMEKPDGSIVVDLMDVGLDSKILLRADGTTVYATQDLALAKKRLKETKADTLVYIVGQEQDYHFKVLFTILERLGLAKPEQLKHLSYHWVFLPEGRMKSREGKVVDADDLLDELNALAKKEIKKRNEELTTQELERRAETIALAAVKFYLLAIRMSSDIKFNPEESIAFNGKTGPYLLYTLARIKSILRKTKAKPSHNTPEKITANEWQIILTLARLPEQISRAAEAYDPSIITDYVYALAKTFTTFYETDHVLTADPKTLAWRLAILKSTEKILAKSFELLGIETLEEM